MSRIPIPRHYGLDWLRIAAFAILIVYHVGMVFVHWGFHVKSLHGARWVVLPMLAVNAWRLSLLFVVSGYASRALLTRAPGIGGFVRQRTLRLLVPLAFGVAVIVPPQVWVELVTQRGYTGDFAQFWARDYFRFGAVGGIVTPALNHLWFVLYLWLYTLVLAIAVLTIRWNRAQALFDRVFAGPALILLPTTWFICIHAWWFRMGYETHDPTHDLMAHLSYLPAFLFGFGLAGSASLLATAVRWRWIGAAMSLAGYCFVLAAEWRLLSGSPRLILPLYGAAHAIQQWGTIVALIGFAERHWNRDAPIRQTLTEGVFPFYLIHQTIIVIVAYWLIPANLTGGAEFAILVSATVGGCALFYLIGRRIAPLRPLIGLRPLPHPSHKAA